MKLTASPIALCIACLLAGAMLLTGCADQPEPVGPVELGLGPAPWQDGSSADYDWLDRSGTEIGTSHVQFALQGDEWIISETDAIAELNQTTALRISTDTLEPLAKYKTIQAPETSATITGTFASGTLSIEAVVNGEARTASRNIPANRIANDQLLMTLRALPFAEGVQAKYAVIVVDSAREVDMTLTVERRETIQVPAGIFEAWYVALAFGRTTHTAWYQVDPPHMLIQYDNGVNRMVLASAQPGL